MDNPCSWSCCMDWNGEISCSSSTFEISHKVKCQMLSDVDQTIPTGSHVVDWVKHVVVHSTRLFWIFCNFIVNLVVKVILVQILAISMCNQYIYAFRFSLSLGWVIEVVKLCFPLTWDCGWHRRCHLIWLHSIETGDNLAIMTNICHAIWIMILLSFTWNLII